MRGLFESVLLQQLQKRFTAATSAARRLQRWGQRSCHPTRYLPLPGCVPLGRPRLLPSGGVLSVGSWLYTVCGTQGAKAAGAWADSRLKTDPDVQSVAGA